MIVRSSSRSCRCHCTTLNLSSSIEGRATTIVNGSSAAGICNNYGTSERRRVSLGMSETKHGRQMTVHTLCASRLDRSCWMGEWPFPGKARGCSQCGCWSRAVVPRSCILNDDTSSLANHSWSTGGQTSQVRKMVLTTTGKSDGDLRGTFWSPRQLSSASCVGRDRQIS